MKIKSENKDFGIRISNRGRVYKLVYPDDIWKKYPTEIRKVLFDNLTYILTVNSAVITKSDELKYNTAVPLYKNFFDKMIRGGIPAAVDDFKETPEDGFKIFDSIKFKFASNTSKKKGLLHKTGERAVISFSSGKDSLLSLAICNEIGLNPVAVYIDDTVSPKENKLKREFIEKVSKEFGIDFKIITNGIEKINDFETWDEDESLLGYTHLVTGFPFVLLPINYAFGAKYTILGNGNNFNSMYITSDNFKTSSSFDQTSVSMLEQSKIIGQLTKNTVSVMSVIEPLECFAVFKILLNRYRDYAKYMISCGCLDATREKRWCKDCSTCLRYYMYCLALGVDPKIIGIYGNLLGEKYKEYFNLFDGKKLDQDDKTKSTRDEELLIFYMAYKNGVRGYLIDMFRDKFLSEAKKREAELMKAAFSISESKTMPKKIKNRVMKIFKEEILQ